MLASNYKSAVVKEQKSNNRCCCILTQRKIKAFLFKQPSEFRRRCTLMHHDVLAVQTVVDLRVYDIAPECTMSVPLRHRHGAGVFYCLWLQLFNF